MKKDILFLNAELIQLTLNNLVDQKNFLRKIFRGEGFFSCQVDICAEAQQDAEKEKENITHPPLPSSSPVRLFSHGTL